MFDPKEKIIFSNHYKCSECGHEWVDMWSCACNDRCPVCDTETEPHLSEEIEEE